MLAPCLGLCRVLAVLGVLGFAAMNRAARSSPEDTLKGKAASPGRYILDDSGEAQGFKNGIVQAATRLPRSWAFTSKATPRDNWPVKGWQAVG